MIEVRVEYWSYISAHPLQIHSRNHILSHQYTLATTHSHTHTLSYPHSLANTHSHTHTLSYPHTLTPTHLHSRIPVYTPRILNPRNPLTRAPRSLHIHTSTSIIPHAYLPSPSFCATPRISTRH